MRTPLARVRGLGSAKAGTGHFWHQRLTAVSNLVLIVALLFVVVSYAGASHDEALAGLGRPWLAGLLVLALASVAYHMKLGMQVIVEDYVHGERLKLVLIVATNFYAVAIFVAGAFAVLGIAFGGG